MWRVLNGASLCSILNECVDCNLHALTLEISSDCGTCVFPMVVDNQTGSNDIGFRSIDHVCSMQILVCRAVKINGWLL